LENASSGWVDQISSRLAEDRISAGEIEPALEWLEAEGKLRFDSLRVSVAERLLQPFRTSRPSEQIQVPLRTFLLRHLGDPRAPRRPGWSGVREQDRQVLCRWLVTLALDDFFRLISETALDRHWKYRKAFWSAYLNEDLISDAWIALGRGAARSARSMLEDEEQTWGRLQKAGVEANHSVLLMRIDSVTIAEWSHMGSCRFWLDGNARAPRFYRDSYSRTDLVTGADYTQPHWSPERGHWQRLVAAWLEDQTKISIPRREYMSV
jgi:hypothetical protein